MRILVGQNSKALVAIVHTSLNSWTLRPACPYLRDSILSLRRREHQFNPLWVWKELAPIRLNKYWRSCSTSFIFEDEGRKVQASYLLPDSTIVGWCNRRHFNTSSHCQRSHLSESFNAFQGCHRRLTLTPSGGVGAHHRRVFTELVVAWPVGEHER